MHHLLRQMSYLLPRPLRFPSSGTFLLVVLLCSPRPPGLQGQAPRARDAVLDSLVDAEIQRRQPFAGLQLVVAQDGEIRYRRNHGFADLEHEVPMSPDVVFQIASITKEFTAAAILKLVEEGRISLDDDIRDYVPDVDTEGLVVRIRHLLNHTSGIPDIYELEAWPDIRPLRLDRSGTRERVLSAAADQGMDFEPGTDWKYSNTGYDLLGDVIGIVSGTDVPSYFRQILFEPLGLDHTSFCPWSRIIPGRARGYEPDGDSLVNAFRQSQGVLFTSGGICSTVDDLIEWNLALHRGRVLRPETYQRMITPEGPTHSYGFGISVGDLDGHPHLGHNGYINGYSSQLEYFPDDGLSIAILTNTPAAVGGLAEDIARSILGLPPRPAAVRPQGWRVRTVPAGADTAALDFRTMGPGVHVTGGPGALYFDPDSVAGSPYKVGATFVQMADPDPDEGQGLVLAGHGLDAPDAEYLRFLVRGAGEYALTRHREGVEEFLIPWSSHPAIREKTQVGVATNALQASVSDGQLALSANEEILQTLELPDGIDGAGVLGLWIGAGSDVHVDGFHMEVPPPPP